MVVMGMQDIVSGEPVQGVQELQRFADALGADVDRHSLALQLKHDSWMSDRATTSKGSQMPSMRMRIFPLLLLPR